MSRFCFVPRRRRQTCWRLSWKWTTDSWLLNSGPTESKIVYDIFRLVSIVKLHQRQYMAFYVTRNKRLTFNLHWKFNFNFFLIFIFNCCVFTGTSRSASWSRLRATRREQAASQRKTSHDRQVGGWSASLLINYVILFYPDLTPVNNFARCKVFVQASALELLFLNFIT